LWNHLLGIRKTTIAATAAATIAKYVRAVLLKRRLGNMILTSWYTYPSRVTVVRQPTTTSEWIGRCGGLTGKHVVARYVLLILFYYYIAQTVIVYRYQCRVLLKSPSNLTVFAEQLTVVELLRSFLAGSSPYQCV